MKSRLLPPPTLEDRESVDDLPMQEYARRATDAAEVPNESKSKPVEPAQSPPVEPYEPALRPAPQISTRPKGRLIMAGILLMCVLSVAAFVWNTFFRDAAYGVVTGKVTSLSPSWPGTLEAIYVRAGESVRQGDVLAIINDPELESLIERLQDNLHAAQAELDAQVALIALAARKRGNETEEIRANYYDLRGELLAEQSRYEELSSKLKRRQELAERKAYSSEEIESLRFIKQGLAAKIENHEKAVTTLELRLTSLPPDDHDTAQLKPQLAKIENFQAEIGRLREKQRRGTMRAPMSGTVLNVTTQVGELAMPEQPVLEFLPEEALELVLYVKQYEASDYQVDQRVEVVIEPIADPIVCRVARIGGRLEKPLSHVVGRYRPEEKLLPVYLTPNSELNEETHLRIGSTVRLPMTLFGL